MTLSVGQTIQATVEKVVFQGRGLIRYNGWVIFADGVLAGEEVRLKIVRKKKSYYEADVEKIVTPAASRVVPKCPYFGRCGGCQLQHSSYAHQCMMKREWVEETLSHAVQLPSSVEAVEAPFEWNYRRKIVLHFRWDQGRYFVGYIAKDGATLLDITSCPIFTADQESVFKEVRAFLSHIEGYKGLQGDVTLLRAKQNGFLVRISFEPRLPYALKQQEMASFIPASWLSLSLESKREKKEFGARELVVEQAGLQTVITPHIFLQNFPEQSLRLYRDVIAHLSSESMVLDLYCGSGLMTQMIAQKTKFAYGIEWNQEAIRCAKKSAQLNKISNVQFESNSVENGLEKILKLHEFTTVIVNPPRVGLSEEVMQAMQQVGARLPQQLIYISCYPSTLARDLKRFESFGYRVEGEARAYDLFPQTTHVETVIQLVRN